MKLKNIIIIEDNALKFGAIKRELAKLGYSDCYHVESSEDAIAAIEQSIIRGEAYDLLISDMQFFIDGKLDDDAGLKTWERLKERNIEIPVIFCSSYNLRIGGCIGTVCFREERDWESELKDAIEKLKKS